MINLTIKGRAVPQTRPRFGNGRVYEASNSRDWRDEQRSQMMDYMGNMAPLMGTLNVALVYYMTPPNSWSTAQKKREYGKLISKRPDIDNYAKSTLDAGNEILWEDDGQIGVLTIIKRYHTTNKVTINVTQVKD